ncbi:hypothetical protein KIPB_015405, partial [Kipferlia bialata]
DLGSSFSSLRSLYVENCGLTSLDGVSQFKGLQSLFAAHNKISDLSDLSMLTSPTFSILDLRDNALDTEAQLFYCGNLPLLHLGMASNPFSEALIGSLSLSPSP